MIPVKHKKGVKLYRETKYRGGGVVPRETIRPEITMIIPSVAARFEQCGASYCMITSAMDGTHSEKSLHYKGLALDFRIKHLSRPDDAGRITANLRRDLGDNYDVVLEKTHIHIEYDPD